MGDETSWFARLLEEMKMTDYSCYVDEKGRIVKRSKKSIARTIPKEEQHIHPYGKGCLKHKKKRGDTK